MMPAYTTYFADGAIRPDDGERGAALFLCLLVSATIALIGALAMHAAGLNQKIVTNGLRQSQAFYLADSGLEAALARLQHTPGWRGDGAYPGLRAAMDADTPGGCYEVIVSDATDDGKGIFDPLLPAGHVRLTASGVFMGAMQTVSCLIEIAPDTGAPASFPRKAVAAAGVVSGGLTAQDQWGVPDAAMAVAGGPLPDANAAALRTAADIYVETLDDAAYDHNGLGAVSFWKDPPANTRPHVVHVGGNLDLSGGRLLSGIVVVDGDRVSLSGTAGVRGVLYAPNASTVSVYNTGNAGRAVSVGLLVSGGDIDVTGAPVVARVADAYVDVFNSLAGPVVQARRVSGTWMSF